MNIPEVTGFGDSAFIRKFSDKAIHYLVPAGSSDCAGLGPRLPGCSTRAVSVSIFARKSGEPIGRPMLSP
jgi:hypothetical protein